MANKEEKQINPWDLLRADVKMYQADCLLSIGFNTQCQRCTKTVFDSIINMINKYAKQSGSGAPERKTGKWVREYQGKKTPVMDKNGKVKESCFCSECGDWLTASDEYDCRGYYCPNCGAKMAAADEEADK